MNDPPVSYSSPLESMGVDPPDGAWELPELAAASILASVGLLMIGGAIFGFFAANANSDPGFASPYIWIGVQVAVRWFDPTTTALLLGALAVCWWQYGEWTNRNHSANAAAAIAHVQRLRQLSFYLVIAFVVAILAATLSVIAGIIINASNPGPTAYEWGSDISTFFSSLAVIVIAGLGLVAGRRVERAALVHLARHVVIAPEGETLT